MDTFLSWLHWIRLIAHRHPNAPAWAQGIGSLMAVFAALWIFWRQGKAKEVERREDNVIRQNISRQESELRIETFKQDREAKIEYLLISAWPLIIQVRSRIANVLATLRHSLQKTPMFISDQSYYAKYVVGDLNDWVRLEHDFFIFGIEVSTSIANMLAIIRQYDREIRQLENTKKQVDYRTAQVLLRNAKVHADSVMDFFEAQHIKKFKRTPPRSVFTGRAAKAQHTRVTKALRKALTDGAMKKPKSERAQA